MKLQLKHVMIASVLGKPCSTSRAFALKTPRLQTPEHTRFKVRTWCRLVSHQQRSSTSCRSTRCSSSQRHGPGVHLSRVEFGAEADQDQHARPGSISVGPDHSVHPLRSLI